MSGLRSLGTFKELPLPVTSYRLVYLYVPLRSTRTRQVTENGHRTHYLGKNDLCAPVIHGNFMYELSVFPL